MIFASASKEEDEVKLIEAVYVREVAVWDPRGGDAAWEDGGSAVVQVGKCGRRPVGICAGVTPHGKTVEAP